MPRHNLARFCASVLILGALPVPAGVAQQAPPAEPALVAPSTFSPAEPVLAGESRPENPEARPLAAYRAPQPAPAGEDVADLAYGVAGKLALVVLVIFACAAGWKMVQAAIPQNALQSTPSVQVSSTVALASQRFLHLVTIGGQRLLLASSPQQVALLGSLDGTNGFVPMHEAGPLALGSGAIAALPPAPDRFDEMLQRLSMQEERRTPVPAPPSSLFAIRPAPSAALRSAIELGPSRLGGPFAEERRDLGSRSGSQATNLDAGRLGSLFHVAPGSGGTGSDG